MTKEDRDALLRTVIMGALVAESGQKLVPDLIGELTKMICAHVIEVQERYLDGLYKG